MKRRIADKKKGQVIGTCPKCGGKVYNFVSYSPNGYNGGSCIECDEDMYRHEIKNYHRRGNPVVISK